MKYISLAIFAIALFFSSNSFSKLDPAVQTIADMVLSGEDSQLKAAAQRVSSAKITEPELIDILAEVLAVRYARAYPSEVDTLAWVARAIGSSENSRYHSILTEVVERTEHKKLRRHVKKALGQLGELEGEQYIAGSYKLPAGIYAAESDSQREDRIYALIMAGDLKSLKQGAKSIIDTQVQNTKLTDALAEVLATHYANPADNQIDTFAWMATAIGGSNSGRYVDILSEIEENSANKKLRKYAKRALKTHGDAKGEQYKKGMLGATIASYTF